jgi:hypothetical protein
LGSKFIKLYLEYPAAAKDGIADILDVPFNAPFREIAQGNQRNIPLTAPAQ